MKQMFTHIHLLQFRHYSLSEKDDQLRLVTLCLIAIFKDFHKYFQTNVQTLLYTSFFSILITKQ